jgi:hypothetical protein
MARELQLRLVSSFSSGQYQWITRQRLILPTAAVKSWGFGNHISLYEQQQQ